MSNNPIDVKILNKTFQVNCPTGAEDRLHEAAKYLDHKLREIRNQGRVIGSERLAIMAALNITHELLSLRHHKEVYVQTVTQQIECLQNKLDTVLIESDVVGSKV